MQLGLNNAEGGTPLIRAVQSGDVRLVDVVIEAGASPGQPCGCAGAESALRAAAHFGYMEIAARLVAAGAEPDAAAFGGVTPLIVAAQRGHHEIAMPDPAIYPSAGAARRAQGLHRYLAQPFVLWEHRTSEPGESTPYDELLDRVERLLSADVYHN